ncbi:MAG TPA: AMP-binding protein, partial [Agitococcus sp.]|nr:AMP-binding protein [Agitococcus sp.]
SIRIVGDDNQDCPLGECGELWVKGPQVMKEYWRHAQATADTITFDGWLKTGDIAQIQADGYLRIVDRKKDIITIGGFNVYPNEIEAVVGQHPAIIECAVVGMIDEQGNEAIKLFIVRKDAQLTENQLQDYLLGQLATYKLPQQIVFVESLPKSSIGKVLRRELKV